MLAFGLTPGVAGEVAAGRVLQTLTSSGFRSLKGFPTRSLAAPQHSRDPGRTVSSPFISVLSDDEKRVTAPHSLASGIWAWSQWPLGPPDCVQSSEEKPSISLSLKVLQQDIGSIFSSSQDLSPLKSYFDNESCISQAPRSAVTEDLVTNERGHKLTRSARPK